MRNQKQYTGGFTLIELIVVIAILVILAAIALPQYAGLQNQSKEVVCQSNRTMAVREIMSEMAIGSLTADAVASYDLATNGYTCPSDGTLSARVDNDTVLVSCSVHQEATSGGSGGGTTSGLIGALNTTGLGEPLITAGNALAQFFNEGWTAIEVEGKDETMYTAYYKVVGNEAIVSYGENANISVSEAKKAVKENVEVDEVREMVKGGNANSKFLALVSQGSGVTYKLDKIYCKDDGTIEKIELGDKTVLEYN